MVLGAMGFKILVVEDELTLSETIRADLEAEGYRVRMAIDGHAAVPV